MIGKNIKRIRQQKGLTLSECAEKANISKSYLSNIERHLNKNPSIHILGKIATALDVNLIHLVESDPDSENEWFDFINELKKSGVDKEQLQEYKQIIEFAKWKKEKNKDSSHE